MHYAGLILAGNNQDEISSIAKTLSEKFPAFKVLNFQTDSSYTDAQKTVTKTTEESRIPLILASPKRINELIDLKNLQFITAFVHSPTSSLQNEGDKGNSQFYNYNIVNNHLSATVELLLKLWQNSDNGGLVPQEIIKLMIKCDMLLENADLTNATGSAFDLTLDDEYYHNGSVRHLDTMDSFIIMEPGDYALVGSSEIANLPRDIAGKFGLSVSLFMQGIILSNGPQIDPGFKGRLYCLLFNTSSQQFQLKRGQHYATIEFVKLLEPTLPYEGKYQGCTTLSQYLPRSIPSSAIGELAKDVKGLKREKLWVKTLPLIISLAALIIAIFKLLS